MNNIDYETIISSFDDKGTLLKWLKTIDAKLKGAKVTSSSWRVVEGEESNTAYLTLTTSDGVSFETEGLVIPKTTSAQIISVIDGVVNQYSATFNNLSQLVAGVEEAVNFISSVGATEGQVLTSNGDGTSAWKDTSGGGSKLYKHDLIMPIVATISSVEVSATITYSIITNDRNAFTNSSLLSYFSSIYGTNQVLLNSYTCVNGGPAYKYILTLQWGRYGPPTNDLFVRIISVDETEFVSTTRVIGSNFTDVVTEL